ncbi:hemerythrin domain-containing protein [Microbacterium sp. ZW T5_56]|uniref:hemerythrin domain-containing protein n=1 Tax=Microbacterium sp. ZW T5_56 TaxID=3378081 RepID=UPI003852F6F4
MTVPDESERLVAWGAELRAVHARLRAALTVVREADGSDAVATRDLLLVCHGFCVALTQHHQGEDRQLFPAIAAAHPELRDTLMRLQQDHSMIGALIASLDAVAGSDEHGSISRHLDGIAAIMESHFRYEERSLISVLDALALDAEPREVLGSL